MVIEDFWTSREGRREFAWLVTEACIWALGHGFYSVDDWTVKGSREYRVSRALGAVKQQSTLSLFTQVFPEDFRLSILGTVIFDTAIFPTR